MLKASFIFEKYIFFYPCSFLIRSLGGWNFFPHGQTQYGMAFPQGPFAIVLNREVRVFFINFKNIYLISALYDFPSGHVHLVGIVPFPHGLPDPFM